MGPHYLKKKKKKPTQYGLRQVAEQKHTQLNEGHLSSIHKPPLYCWFFLKLWENKWFSSSQRGNIFSSSSHQSCFGMKLCLFFFLLLLLFNQFLSQTKHRQLFPRWRRTHADLLYHVESFMWDAIQIFVWFSFRIDLTCPLTCHLRDAA